MEPINPSQLRSNLYRILDEVLESGEAVEVLRHGRRIRIVADSPPRLAALPPHPEAVRGDLEDLVELDWSEAWRP